jgi:hypothetical protein
LIKVEKHQFSTSQDESTPRAAPVGERPPSSLDA